MLYLDYILYIIIIILLYIFVDKIIKTDADGNTDASSNVKEGFEHEGKGKVAVTQGKPSQIEYAEFSYFNKETMDYKVMDVKAMLDQLIIKKTESIIVGPETFGLNSNDHSEEYDYLVIKFKNPYTEVKDGNTESNNSGVWWWSKGDSVSLKFGNGSPDPVWLTVLKALYKIADLFAIIVIQMPYNFLNQLVVTGFIFMQNLEKIFQPIMGFVNSIMSMIRNIVKQIMTWVKWAFNLGLSIMKNIPGFLQSIFTATLDFLQKGITKFFSMLEMFYNLFMTVLNALMQLPLTIFDMVDQLGTVVLNIFMIIINLPTSMLNMVIGFQNIMLQIMEMNPKIPFLNLFFG